MNREQEKSGDVTLIKPASRQQWLLRSMDDGQEYPLKGEMLVGREVECQIPLLSGHVSRYHAKIRVTSAGALLEDLHSTNGTYVNGKRLTSAKLLTLGDEVVFHTARFRVVSDHSGEAEATMLFQNRLSVLPSSVPPEALAVDENMQTTAPRITSFSRPALAVPGTLAAVTDAPGQDEGESTRLLSVSEIALKADRSRNALLSKVPGSGPRLVVMTAPLRGKILPLAAQKLSTTWRLGRGESCELRIEDATVSHEHARIVRGAEGWHIAVSNARNAMAVNGEVQTSHALLEGDRLLLGRMEIVFVTDVDEPLASEPDAKPARVMNPWVLGALAFAFLTSMGVLATLLLR